MISKYQAFSPYKKATLQLVFAGSIWGFSFLCSLWALEDFSTSTLIFWRFLIAFVVGEILFLSFNSKSVANSNSDIKLSLFSGCALGLSLMLQTHGLHYTTATKSSFITSIYVVLIPFAAYFFYKKPLRIHHLLLGLLAFLGMGLLLNLHSQQDFKFNVGDLLTLGCAVTSTFHILLVSAASLKLKSGFRFNVYQTFWALLLIVPFAIYETNFKGIRIWPEQVHLKSILSLLFLSLSVTLVAFYLQVIAQKTLTSATASLLCLLEAPFAFMFAFLILSEKLFGFQSLGIVLILGSSFFSVYMDRPKDRS